jgi:hypothetical protein
MSKKKSKYAQAKEDGFQKLMDRLAKAKELKRVATQPNRRKRARRKTDPPLVSA